MAAVVHTRPPHGPLQAPVQPLGLILDVKQGVPAGAAGGGGGGEGGGAGGRAKVPLLLGSDASSSTASSSSSTSTSTTSSGGANSAASAASASSTSGGAGHQPATTTPLSHQDTLDNPTASNPGQNLGLGSPVVGSSAVGSSPGSNKRAAAPGPVLQTSPSISSSSSRKNVNHNLPDQPLQTSPSISRKHVNHNLPEAPPTQHHMAFRQNTAVRNLKMAAQLRVAGSNTNNTNTHNTAGAANTSRGPTAATPTTPTKTSQTSTVTGAGSQAGSVAGGVAPGTGRSEQARGQTPAGRLADRLSGEAATAAVGSENQMVKVVMLSAASLLPPLHPFVGLQTGGSSGHLGTAREGTGAPRGSSGLVDGGAGVDGPYRLSGGVPSSGPSSGELRSASGPAMGPFLLLPPALYGNVTPDLIPDSQGYNHHQHLTGGVQGSYPSGGVVQGGSGGVQGSRSPSVSGRQTPTDDTGSSVAADAAAVVGSTSRARRLAASTSLQQRPTSVPVAVRTLGWEGPVLAPSSSTRFSRILTSAPELSEARPGTSLPLDAGYQPPQQQQQGLGDKLVSADWADDVQRGPPGTPMSSSSYDSYQSGVQGGRAGQAQTPRNVMLGVLAHQVGHAPCASHGAAPGISAMMPTGSRASATAASGSSGPQLLTSPRSIPSFTARNNGIFGMMPMPDLACPASYRQGGTGPLLPAGGDETHGPCAPQAHAHVGLELAMSDGGDRGSDSSGYGITPTCSGPGLNRQHPPWHNQGQGGSSFSSTAARKQQVIGGCNPNLGRPDLCLTDDWDDTTLDHHPGPHRGGRHNTRDTAAAAAAAAAANPQQPHQPQQPAGAAAAAAGQDALPGPVGTWGRADRSNGLDRAGVAAGSGSPRGGGGLNKRLRAFLHGNTQLLDASEWWRKAVMLDMATGIIYRKRHDMRQLLHQIDDDPCVGWCTTLPARITSSAPATITTSAPATITIGGTVSTSSGLTPPRPHSKHHHHRNPSGAHASSRGGSAGAAMAVAAGNSGGHDITAAAGSSGSAASNTVVGAAGSHRGSGTQAVATAAAAGGGRATAAPQARPAAAAAAAARAPASGAAAAAGTAARLAAVAARVNSRRSRPLTAGSSSAGTSSGSGSGQSSSGSDDDEEESDGATDNDEASEADESEQGGDAWSSEGDSGSEGEEEEEEEEEEAGRGTRGQAARRGQPAGPAGRTVQAATAAAAVPALGRISGTRPVGAAAAPVVAPAGRGPQPPAVAPTSRPMASCFQLQAPAAAPCIPQPPLPAASATHHRPTAAQHPPHPAAPASPHPPPAPSSSPPSASRTFTRLPLDKGKGMVALGHHAAAGTGGASGSTGAGGAGVGTNQVPAGAVMISPRTSCTSTLLKSMPVGGSPGATSAVYTGPQQQALLGRTSVPSGPGRSNIR